MFKRGGFTIVELVVVIAVIGVLLSVTMFSIRGLSIQGRDKERESDATSIARQLELVYNNQTLGAPIYPAADKLSAADRDTLFGGKQADTTRAPGQTSFSIVEATNQSGNINPRPSVTNDKYVYQPQSVSSGACDNSGLYVNSCVKFKLYYWVEATNSVAATKSLKQQ